MDHSSFADRLVAEITAAVHKRFNPRAKVLVPPRLTGYCRVPDLKAGERVVDRADELLETATDDWPGEVDAEVYLDLLQQDGHWQIAWVVDTTGSDDADAPDEAEPVTES